MLRTEVSNRFAPNFGSVGQKFPAAVNEPKMAESKDAVQLGSLDIPGDIPMSVLWGLNAKAPAETPAPAPKECPAPAAELPSHSSLTSSFDVPGDMPYMVAWGLNKPEAPATQSVPGDLSYLDVPGDIPSNILWNLR